MVFNNLLQIKIGFILIQKKKLRDIKAPNGAKYSNKWENTTVLQGFLGWISGKVKIIIPFSGK